MTLYNSLVSFFFLVSTDISLKRTEEYDREQRAALLANKDTDMFQAIIDFIFKDFKPENGIFTTAKPANILNKTPFIINKVEAYPKIDFKNA